MNAKTLLGWSAFSVCMHAAIGASFYSYGLRSGQELLDRSVTISYVETPSSAADVPQPRPTPAPAIAANVPKPIIYKKPERVVRPAVKAAPAAAYDRPAARALPSAAAPLIRDSADILRDPRDGKIFTSYFGQVKERINQVVRRKYSRQTVGEGSVTLVFILNRSGEMESIWVAEGQTSAGQDAKDFAVRCVKSAAPFPDFPRELDLQKIAFNIKLRFEEI